MNITLATPPAIEPVSLAEAKAHLRVFETELDDTITAIIGAVTSHLDGRHGILGRALISQTWALKLRKFPVVSHPIKLPFPPLQEVVSVNYLDATGQEVVMPIDDYHVEPGEYEAGIYSVSGGWPRSLLGVPYPVTVRFVVGYGDNASDVPKALKQAMLLMIGKLYNCPDEGTKNAVDAFSALIAPYRIAEMAI